MSSPTSLHIGTSGWHYQHWKGAFYPEDLPEERFLDYYTKFFGTAEINNTFYHLPEKKTFMQWRESVPEGFIFCVKASRYITHMKKLKDTEEPVSKFMERVKLLEDKLGPILFQLPPHWHSNVNRLKEFIKILPAGGKYAFEFRDPSWFGRETEEILAKKGAAFCIYDFDHRQSPTSLTADFAYLRLHGPDGAYRGNYNHEALTYWAKNISQWMGENKEVFCYFDNDERGFAAQNALKLKELIEKL